MSTTPCPQQGEEYLCDDFVTRDPLPPDACCATIKHDVWNRTALMGYAPSIIPVVPPPLTISRGETIRPLPS